MLNRYRRFKTFNISAHRVRKVFVLLFLGTALIIAVIGAFAMIQAESSIQSSSWNQLTSHITPQTLFMIMGQEVPYLRAKWTPLTLEGIMTRLFFEVISSVNPKDPRTFLGRELPMFALFDSDIVEAGPGIDFTSIPIESPPPPELEEEIIRGTKDENGEEKSSLSSQSTQVFIYHTHYWESYLSEVGEKQPHKAVSLDKDKNINRVGKHLEKTLNQLGVSAKASTSQPKTNSRMAYNTSRKKVIAAMKQNQDLNYIIDIHRDSQPRQKTTLTINGKTYAKLAFVVGKSSKYYQQNRKLAQRLHERLNKVYPGLSRAVIEKPKTRGINGEYNQSLSPNSMLIEVGGVGNTFSEAYRSTEVLAKVLSEEILEATPVIQQK